MGREEAEAVAALFQYIEAIFKHVGIVKGSCSCNDLLYEIRELVAESEGKQYSCCHDQAFLPSQSPDKTSYYENIHRNPHRYVGKELPDGIADAGVHAIDGKGDHLICSMNS